MLAALCLPAGVSADVARVAVASNFASAAKDLAAAFHATSGHGVEVVTASTGTLYAQIVNGAPFDLLLAADELRPSLLDSSGLAVPGSRFTYAVGRLVLWSRDPQLGPGECRRALDGSAGRIALANPDTAPYGAAARDALVTLGLWETARKRLVFGENVAQVFQFVATGNAQLGFIAGSQAGIAESTCAWEVTADLHEPIRQQAVLLERAAVNAAAEAFLFFLQDAEGRAIIRGHGYGLDPDG